MSAHLGPAVTALVDGELDHTRRDEVLAHLAHCAPCRAEVEALRRFKAALRGAVDVPSVPSGLTARLLAATEPLPRLERPVRRLLLRSRLRRTVVGSAFVVMGAGAVISLAGPPPGGPVAPVDPADQRFLLEHATTTAGEVPFTELDVVSVSRAGVSVP